MTVPGADFALQQAIYSKLIATSALTVLLADGVDGVYDAAPDGVALPFVVIGDHELENGELKICERITGKVTVNVHARQADGAPPVIELTKSILAEIDAALDATLAVVGYGIIVFSVDFSAADVDPVDHKSATGRLTFNLDMIEG